MPKKGNSKNEVNVEAPISKMTFDEMVDELAEENSKKARYFSKLTLTELRELLRRERTTVKERDPCLAIRALERKTKDHISEYALTHLQIKINPDAMKKAEMLFIIRKELETRFGYEESSSEEEDTPPVKAKPKSKATVSKKNPFSDYHPATTTSPASESEEETPQPPKSKKTPASGPPTAAKAKNSHDYWGLPQPSAGSGSMPQVGKVPTPKRRSKQDPVQIPIHTDNEEVDSKDEAKEMSDQDFEVVSIKKRGTRASGISSPLGQTFAKDR
jgi:hypothetical protein